MARDRLHLAPAVLRLAAPRRRVRHQRLLLGAARLRLHRRRRRADRGGPQAGHAGDRRHGDEPHLGPAPLVPGEPAGPHQPQGRLVRVGRRRPALERGAGHLRGHRAVQLELRRAARPVLLAPLLPPPARPQLRQPRGRRRDARRGPVLAEPRPRRVPPRRGAVPVRARRHQRREPPRDPRVPPPGPQDGRRGVPGSGAAGRGEPVAGRRRRLLRRRRRRVPHVLPLPADAADVHGGAAGAAAADHGDPGPDPGDPRRLPVGDLPAQPRRADPGDGHRRGAGLHVRGVRVRSSDAAEHRHRPPAVPAPRQRRGRGPALPRHALLDAREPGALLRRRDRDGRQHLPRRPRRRAHADAVDARPQRRLLHRRTSRSSTCRR